METRKIVEYKILTRYCLEIEKEVEIAIEEGWQPLGGMMVSNRKFYQTMVKYEELDL